MRLLVELTELKITAPKLILAIIFIIVALGVSLQGGDYSPLRALQSCCLLLIAALIVHRNSSLNQKNAKTFSARSFYIYIAILVSAVIVAYSLVASML
jgi:small-conductance mechanosensitive channel